MMSVIKMLFPHGCVFCGDSHERERICQRCISVLPRNERYCECCGQPVITELPAGVTCAACQRLSPAFAKARSPFHYAFPVDTALKAMKFRGQLMYAPAFASLLLPVLESEFPDCDSLVAVPLHRWRHIKRGFNQADELCKALARGAELPVIDCAIRQRATKTQSGLGSAVRRRNLRGAFAVDRIRARYPLIIDDVITTGATCEHLALALLVAGARKVGVLTVARSSTLAI
jgi:ComF family protein